MTKVVGIRFKPVGKIYYFNPEDCALSVGDGVIVETTRGVEFGEVVLDMTYPRAFWRFMEIFLSGYGVCAALYIPIVCTCDKIHLLFTRKRPRSLRSCSERGRCAFS